MRLLGTAIGVLLVAACASSPSAAPAQTPSPTKPPVAKAFAVMVHRAGVGEPYIVQLVGPSGAGGPSVSPVSRSDKGVYSTTPCPPNAMCPDLLTANYNFPETSVSSTRVYFLDGETQVRALAPDGTVTSIKNIEAPANSDVVFAVSPDDKRMAVAVITLATSLQPAGAFAEHMYVEDLTTADRVDLYSSTKVGKWPVAWHAGDLVVGTGAVDLENLDNPYGAGGYEVLDAATGQTVSALDCSAGLLVRAGTACVDGGCISTTTCTTAATVYRQGWGGVKTQLALPGGPAERIFAGGPYTALSPRGDRLAAQLVTDPATGATETAVIQGGAIVYTTTTGAPQGWLDDDHLIVWAAGEVDIIDLRSGATAPMTNLRMIPQQGTPRFMGMLPADLG